LSLTAAYPNLALSQKPDPMAPALHGIHAILYAPFDASEHLDRSAMRRQADLCLAAGVHGIAALGLATEVAKLSETERRTMIDWVAEDTAGRVPLGITISGTSMAEQIALSRHAEAAGANWLILQPPAVGCYDPAEYIRFFGRVAGAASIPVGIQDAPQYIKRGLSADEIRELIHQHPNICVLKAEAPAAEIRYLVDLIDGQAAVFNGRGGLELTDNLRAGCAGLILAPEMIDHAVRAYNFFRHDEAVADGAYAAMLPAIVFVMQSLEGLVCYGKRLFAARAGLTVYDRAPALRPTEFGLDTVRRFAEILGSLP
jgi:dihydrodipicolinate synthase/N-acetylneuraminate lyase